MVAFLFYYDIILKITATTEIKKMRNTNIENQIKAVLGFNVNAMLELYAQYLQVMNSDFTRYELMTMLKTDEDIADMYFVEGTHEHSEIREIQDAIINFYGQNDE